MSFEIDAVDKAFRIFTRLLEAGKISDVERDLFAAYQESSVREVLEDIIEKHAGVKVLATADMIYISPSVDNPVFGFTNEALRAAMSLRDNQELYTAYFILLCLLAMLFNSDDQAAMSREFVPVEELEAYVTAQLERVKAADEDDVIAIEDDIELNLRNIAETWLDLPSFDDKLKNLNLGRNNRVSQILRVMRFCEEQELVMIMEQREIRPTPKLEHVVTRYYFNSHRKERILSLITRPLPLLAKEAHDTLSQVGVSADAED